MINYSIFLAAFLSISNAQSLNQFTLMTVRSGSKIQFNSPSVNNNRELVIDHNFRSFKGYFDVGSGTVKYNDTSLLLDISSENQVIVSKGVGHVWEFIGGYQDGTPFPGYFTWKPDGAFVAVPYHDQSGFKIFTSEYQPKKGEKTIPFEMIPDWFNTTTPTTSSRACSI